MSTALGYLGGFVVLVALAIACMGLRDVRARRRAWEEYERRRDAGGRAGVEPTRPW